jgi:hypothetical protein
MNPSALTAKKLYETEIKVKNKRDQKNKEASDLFTVEKPLEALLNLVKISL